MVSRLMDSVASSPAAKRARLGGGHRQWDGAQRVVINTGGKCVEITRRRLGALGKGFLTEQPEGKDEIFLDFPSDTFDTLHGALVLARNDLDKALRVLHAEFEGRRGPVLAELLEYLGLGWVKGITVQPPLGEKSISVQRDTTFSMTQVQTMFGQVSVPLPSPEAVDACSTSRDLSKGILVMLASKGVLPFRFDRYDQNVEMAKEQPSHEVIYCTVEHDFWEEVHDDPDDGPPGFSLESRCESRIISFGGTCIEHNNVSKAHPAQSDRDDYVRFIFDVGKGRLVLLQGVAISLCAYGASYDVDIQVKAEMLSDFSQTGSVDKQAPLEISGQVRPCHDPASYPHINHCGRPSKFWVPVPWGGAHGQHSMLSRMFALSIKSRSTAKHALSVLVLRQFELYGKVIEVPEDLRQGERDHFSFDADSLACRKIGGEPLGYSV